ncbi:hypothetical protein [Paraburkholderia fynbosensis]|uniref:hypothetical protein n=1 Tax=Paraburkholderia fynbosensis TaxID=1200993 RepID=UPI001583E87E|nr:hypothetical protein [Paraburkholderia fynbosensis]
MMKIEKFPFKSYAYLNEKHSRSTSGVDAAKTAQICPRQTKNRALNGTRLSLARSARTKRN